MKFEEMNIEKSVLDSLKAIGFETATKIQAETIPIIKQGFDVIGQSETGSGKTAAFGIPLIEKVERNGRLQSLVLAPTRELAIQIKEDFMKYSRFKKLYIQTVYGGVSMLPQISGLRRAEIVVGTPGRVLDHMKRGTLDARNVKIFVLDEADKMIDMGFVDDIREIEKHIPKNRQTLLFSATMPDNLIGIASSFTNNAKRIRTELKVREDLLRQFFVNIDTRSKFSLLVHLIQSEPPKLGIIFCNSRRDADNVARNLQRNNINAIALHGGLTQNRREQIMNDFHKGITEILVATDVAGRGLDIRNVTHIFNYGIPKTADDYANRIGRTARAGASGVAISLLSRDDHESFRKIIRSFSYEIEKMEVPHFKMLSFERSHSEGGRDFGRGYGRSFHRRFGRKPFRRNFRRHYR